MVGFSALLTKAIKGFVFGRGWVSVEEMAVGKGTPLLPFKNPLIPSSLLNLVG